MELNGKTIGIVGIGNIGSAIVRIAHAFGMHIIGTVNNMSVDRRDSLAKQGITLENLDQLLTKSDIVCLAVPLTASTKELINHDKLAMMKRDAILVNISRAEIIDHDALLKALAEKIIKGFATDVLPTQDGEGPFSKLDNVVVTPHIGAMTHEAQKRIGQEVVAGIIVRLAEGSTITTTSARNPTLIARI